MNSIKKILTTILILSCNCVYAVRGRTLGDRGLDEAFDKVDRYIDLYNKYMSDPVKPVKIDPPWPEKKETHPRDIIDDLHDLQRMTSKLMKDMNDFNAAKNKRYYD